MDRMEKRHRHHVIPTHLGGSDEEANLIEIDFIEHAKLHAERFLRGEDQGFDNRHTGWPYLPESLKNEVKKKQGSITREKNLKKVEDGTHPFLTDEFRFKQSERTRKRNLELSKDGCHPAQIASQEGRHPWQTDEHRERAKKQMTEQNKQRTENDIPFYSQTPEGRDSISKRQTQLIEEGNHFFGSEKHRKQAKEKTTERNKANKGAKHWVNCEGERKYQKESPGPEWQNGQKWRDQNAN